MNPDDQGQNPTQPPAGQPPSGDQPVSPPAEKCVTCGNAAAGGNCVACGQGEVSCTCQPAQGGGTPPPAGEQPTGAPAV